MATIITDNKARLGLPVQFSAPRARVLVGRYDEWLYVETPEKKWDWVAAWYVSTAQT